ncbi:amidophosphoribosyltransferase [Candidatus Nitrosacidococcus tergens]|uniref:Amidophosphoribosyltransferase n=1 Tax=Candidatus Nitrosacidococcus tergens TaxID=553981 RepID=A0A7G1Q9N9_9GAMM|nr:amidophosphoribosyltransferase [Candidatus Nitrosacidococcus tergens]CAB1275945.1 amidophosphoribosyltransferase [Candidatus Nitrosacidococcus tergens]
MSGVIGIVATEAVNQALYDGLTVLQHRGQDAAGIVTYDNGKLYLRKGSGLVKDVFRINHMVTLKGCMGIGHVRYPTSNSSSPTEAQPFYVNSPYGITIAHNGNLTNAAELKQALFQSDKRHINTNSDSEILLNVLAHELQKLDKITLTPDDLFAAVSQVYKRCHGAYAAIVMIAGYGILAFRDPCGIRPLAFGSRFIESENKQEYIVASESVAIDSLGYNLIRDIKPGEAIFIDCNSNFYTRKCVESNIYAPCIFEYVYLARPDSIVDNISVHKSRMRMGEKLARKILQEWPDHDINVVIPIPDTSRSAALQLAYVLGVVYREGFIKNRYIGRTFIMPGQRQRKKSVRQKLNPISLEFKNKNVLLVDDSIVRGTTSQQIIQMARDAGAKKVYFASASPPVRYPNVYGIDMPAVSDLIAYNRSEEEISILLGADRLIYQNLSDLIEAAQKYNPNITKFDTSCFDGDYVTGNISPEYFELNAINHMEATSPALEINPMSAIEIHNFI